MIGIIDYGMGNLHSVSKALERLQFPYFLSSSIEELNEADGLLLPGVGSFHDGMNILNETGLSTFIKDWAIAGKPLLGICLGMQLLFETSEENKRTEGLGLLPGHVKRFSGIATSGESYKVPHMGWNELQFRQPNHPLLCGVEEGHVYFVHSYVVHTEREDVLLATSDYYGEVPAIVGDRNILGAQFHPEKSSAVGMSLLNNFCALVEKGENDRD